VGGQDIAVFRQTLEISDRLLRILLLLENEGFEPQILHFLDANSPTTGNFSTNLRQPKIGVGAIPPATTLLSS